MGLGFGFQLGGSLLLSEPITALFICLAHLKFTFSKVLLSVYYHSLIHVCGHIASNIIKIHQCIHHPSDFFVLLISTYSNLF